MTRATLNRTPSSRLGNPRWSVTGWTSEGAYREYRTGVDSMLSYGLPNLWNGTGGAIAVDIDLDGRGRIVDVRLVDPLP